MSYLFSTRDSSQHSLLQTHARTHTHTLSSHRLVRLSLKAAQANLNKGSVWSCEGRLKAWSTKLGNDSLDQSMREILLQTLHHCGVVKRGHYLLLVAGCDGRSSLEANRGSLKMQNEEKRKLAQIKLLLTFKWVYFFVSVIKFNRRGKRGCPLPN